MATNSMVPYSNPQGNNQTNSGLNQGSGTGGALPIAVGATGGSVPAGAVQGTTPVVAAAQSNPLIPVAPVSAATTTMNPGSTSNNQTNTQNQLSDIYGQGVGTDLTNLLGSIGGTDSATLQEFQQSLAPQEAVAQANLNASLGAGGVSANSSVAALGNANLQSQEMATVAGEDANLTQSGQNLEASILTGTEQAAQQEVASSGWSVFGDVIGAIGSDVAQGAGAIAKIGGFSGGGTGAADASQVDNVVDSGGTGF